MLGVGEVRHWGLGPTMSMSWLQNSCRMTMILEGVL